MHVVAAKFLDAQTKSRCCFFRELHTGILNEELKLLQQGKHSLPTLKSLKTNTGRAQGLIPDNFTSPRALGYNILVHAQHDGQDTLAECELNFLRQDIS